MNPSILKGHLDGLLLAVLEDGPRHGYGAVARLRELTGGELDLPSGTVYPALHRLERTGQVAGEWSETGGRRRRTYRLTRAGHRALARHRAEWRGFSVLVQRVLGAEP